MKKLWIIGGVVVFLFAALFGLNYLSNQTKLENNPYDKDDLKQSTIDILDDKNYQSIIIPSKLEEKISSGDTTVAYLFSPECKYCKNFTPKLMEVAKEQNIEVNQLNVLEYPEAGQKYGLTATPTLIVYKEGVEVNRIVGDYPEEDVRTFFELNVLNQ